MKLALAIRARRLTRRMIPTLAALIFALPTTAAATTLISSVISSSLSTSSISFTLEITNNTSAASSPVRAEVWAFPAPYTGGELNGDQDLDAAVILERHSTQRWSAR